MGSSSPRFFFAYLQWSLDLAAEETLVHLPALAELLFGGLYAM
jgi:hypothetical protein